MKETRFKDTEIGRIPEEWEVTNLSDRVSLLNGRAYRQEELLNKGRYKVLRVGNFFTNDHWYYSNLLLPAKMYCHKGDLLYAWSCTYGAYIWNEDNTIFHYHIWKVIPNMETSKYYLKYLLNYDVEKQKLTSQGSTMAHITKGFLEARKFAFPSINEQSRIASALTSIDNLISSLDKLIEKKKSIKQGTMQQLLTGKKRLKGFSDPWVDKKLGDILDYEQPTKYLVRSTDYSENGVPVLTAGKTFILGHTAESFGLFTKTPVIIFDDFVTESKYVDFPFKAKSSAMKMLSLRDYSCNLRFVYEIMQMIDFTMTDHKRYWIGQYSQLTVRIPTLNEQNEITKVVTALDDDIIALKSKKDKYESIKQGMMQQLLTGQIRLIKHC